MLTSEEIMDLLAHPRFISLSSVSGGWELVYLDRNNVGQAALFNATLDTLLEYFSVIVEE